MAAPNTSTGDLSNLVAAAYDRKVAFARRSIPTFRTLVDTRPVHQTAPGSSVVFNIHQDLAAATTALNSDGSTDPTGVSLSDTSTVTVTLAEYGNFTVSTNRLDKLNFSDNIEGDIANILAFNQVDSVDKIVEAVMAASTNVVTEEAGSMVTTGTDVANIVGTDTIKSRNIRYAVAKLRGSSVAPKDGSLYLGYIHPDVAHDLRAESGSVLAWREPHTYSDPAGIYAGELGAYEGVRWIETPRCSGVGNDAGSGDVDVYATYVVGQGAVAEAVAEEFHTVVDGVVEDPLKRKKAIGWYGIAGWSLYRTPSLRVIKTASSIGAN